MVHHLPDAERWNHSIHYHRALLDLVPSTARTALDVGCGEGLLSRELSARGLAVTAIDVDTPSIARAREQSTGGIQYVVADVMDADLPEGAFDVVASVATLHHLDLEAGLGRFSALVAPGGVVLVVGLARGTWLDAPREAAAVIVSSVMRARRHEWDHGSPTVWPPPHTYAEVRDAASRVMPGSTFRRRLLWRYTLTWTKPLAR
jgi:2-polyprenyl-3-methyl-5-hydroxy-6-metoxy-1,4-benzoquinol methylase